MTTEGEQRLAALLEEIRTWMRYLTVLSAATAVAVGVKLVLPT